MLYLYFITLLGEFQTAAYYHTAGGILSGLRYLYDTSAPLGLSAV
jgi:hypothetical protein